ncbi:MAG: prolipoprotein diacylglyceryl transferase [Deltaproteobacteria bacterium]|nr:prolipoprotein diacylglyceryl transferase [Deltaproteobacteria bacterium]
MLHTLDPYAVRLWGDFGIRWYGLSYLAGFAAAYLLIKYLSVKGLTRISSSLVSDFVFTVALGTVVGGRLGYCIFYSPELLTRVSDRFPFWGVLAVNEGGMASHGGIAGIIISCAWFARKHGFSGLHAMDLCALTGPIGILFGRIANFVNGELVGRPCEKALSWCVKFPQDIFLWPRSEPQKMLALGDAAQAYGVTKERWHELIGNYAYRRDAWREVEGLLARIVDGVQAGNQKVIEAIEPLLVLRHPSQLYEAALEGLFLFAALLLFWARPRKPGVIMAAFLVIYSVVRIIGEQFRMPDAHIGFQALGLTRGQWLSAGMLAIGLLVWVAVSRRSDGKVGGWYRS